MLRVRNVVNQQGSGKDGLCDSENNDMSASPLVTVTVPVPARGAALTLAHVVVFLVCWFPLNPLALSVCLDPE